MKRYIILPLLLLLLPVQIQGPRTVAYLSSAVNTTPSEHVSLNALSEYKETLETRGQNLNDQGIVIETLDGKRSLGEHNADITFNPASVMKLATSLVALSKFAPDHRYRTDFLAGGAMDAAARKLEGDLVVRGGADPMFSSTDAEEVARNLSKVGIARVTGNLRVAGPFYYYARGYTSNLSRETSAAKLRGILEKSGIKIDGQTVLAEAPEQGEEPGQNLVTHYSDRLDKILLYQNAYSSNAVAEVVGESVGGPQAVQEFLVENLDLRDSEVYVGRTSGLDFNRITPRASIKVLRALLVVLEEYSLKPEDIMPVAGIDSGTLRARLSSDQFRGSVIAKTGTLVSLEKG
ncbi:MAG TPA: D-alanyl-D-alanine carboxypeptidase, partial [Blastocatellia bacterium]|nr:D-alanyl-D-alanine carboxypeptidase [Blastocatellia bacterium]